MVSVNNVSGFSELENFLSNVDSKKSVYLYFTGSKLENGLSWCPDCVEGKPLLFIIRFINVWGLVNLNYMYT